MENHDAAYAAWRDAGVRQRILVHIDAHHDMWWVKDGTPITIANFIAPALKEDMIREVFWVVPDDSWQTARTRRPVLRHVKAIAKGYPQPSQVLRADDHEISAVVADKPLHVLPLRHLPRLEENVLLDIDVDYLVIPRVSHGEHDRHAPVPWCWPDELLSRLAGAGLRSDLATVVYSVEGGYTPLRWKYLGDELALRLRGDGADESALRGMSLLREAALAAWRGDTAAAETCLRQATALLPASAAPCYHLAHLSLKAGREDAAREMYRQALARDPSYKTAYNSAGVTYYHDDRLAEARREHLRTLALDPEDAYAHLGLGQIAADEQCWPEAEASLRAALALDAGLPDAWRVLGKVLARRNCREEAFRAYQHALKLVLHGRQPLTDCIITQPPRDLLLDPHHCAIHADLARLHEAAGALKEAIIAYHFGITGGVDGVAIRWRLARLYLRTGQRHLAIQQKAQLARALAVGSWDCGHWVIRHRWRSIQRAVESAMLRTGAQRGSRVETRGTMAPEPDAR
jgi:tetratricopeptide (TPR) repeat protein